MEKRERYEKKSESKKPESLADQLRELNKPADQRLKELPVHEWSRDLYDFAVNSKTHSCTPKLVQYVSSKYKDEFAKFHSRGTAFKEIVSFIRSKSEELRY